MPERVVITGIGCVSCFGMGHRALIEGIGSGSSGIAPITRFDTADCRSRRAATIRDFDPAAFISPLKLRRVDAVGRVAIACTRLLFEDAGVLPRAEGRDDIGIALGTFTARERHEPGLKPHGVAPAHPEHFEIRAAPAHEHDARGVAERLPRGHFRPACAFFAISSPPGGAGGLPCLTGWSCAHH